MTSFSSFSFCLLITLVGLAHGKNIITVIGSGIEGYSGDGGAPESATINYAKGLAFDNQGNLLLADTINGCIRKVTAGIISTKVRNGNSSSPSTVETKLSYPFDVIFDSGGNMYIADTFNHQIQMINSLCTAIVVSVTGVPGFNGDAEATSSNLNYP